MKTALCVTSITDIQKAINKALSKEEGFNQIKTKLVDREICEKEDSGLQQIIPYVVFFSVNVISGKILFAQYVRSVKGDESRLHAKTSIGFGGHIDHNDTLRYSSTSVEENGDSVYTMTISDLIDTCIAAGTREVIEELGVNMFDKLAVKVNPNAIHFFTSASENPVDKLHIAALIPVSLSPLDFENFFTEAKPNPEEIEKLDTLSIDLKSIIEDYDLKLSLSNIVKQAEEKCNLETWSLCSIYTLLETTVRDITSYVPYEDFIKIAMENYEKKRVEEQKKRDEEQSKVSDAVPKEPLGSDILGTEPVSSNQDVEQCSDTVEKQTNTNT